MALEPISSLTTIQAQQATPEHRVQPTENREVIRQDVPAPVDNTTPVVMNVEQKNAFAEENTPYEQQQNNNEKIRKAVEQLNKNMPHSEAVYGFHEGTNRVTIKIIDKDTKEVIKELPPEKTLDMITKVWEMAGILVDEKR